MTSRTIGHCRRRVFSLIFVVLAACCARLNAQTSSSFDSNGYLQGVDPIHDKLIFRSAGEEYVVDTRFAAIHLLTVHASSTETGDLVVGMRVEIAGNLFGPDVIKATNVQVLPYLPPNGVPVPNVKSVTISNGDTVRLRGRVAETNVSNGTMLLKDGDLARVVRVSNLTIIQNQAGDIIYPGAIQDGDDLNVVGVASTDGSFRAAEIFDLTERPEPQMFVQRHKSPLALTGTISSQSSFFSRNIKVTTSTEEISVAVPRGIAISLDGQPVSIHDLKTGTKVRIEGEFDAAHKFDASSINASTTLH